MFSLLIQALYRAKVADPDKRYSGNVFEAGTRRFCHRFFRNHQIRWPLVLM